MVEIPYLRETKKVKSMQMFHKNVKSARQGDRLGLCLQVMLQCSIGVVF